MRKYLITSPNFKGEMIFGYDNEGVLKFYENNTELETKHLVWLSKNFPFSQTDLPQIVKKGEVKEITDLSFDHFWKEYKYKIGKQQAEKRWRSLTEGERIAVFEHLPKYRYYLTTHRGISQANAATYLNNRRWEDEY